MIILEYKHDKPLRIDKYLADNTEYSRAQITSYIALEFISVNKQIVKKPSYIVHNNDKITIDIKKQEHEKQSGNPDIIAHLNSNIIEKNDDFIIINKPAGISSHKAHAHDASYTLSDWIIENNIWTDVIQNQNNNTIERQGIVHRLDKNTSGLMILTRNISAQEEFIEIFKQHEIIKKYWAITPAIINWQHIVVKSYIKRDPCNPTKMLSALSGGKIAETEFLLHKTYSNGLSLLECMPKTGRTHQIRVHAADKGFSLYGDESYGTPIKDFPRHALHAYYLEFVFNEMLYKYEIPLPQDIKNLICF